MSVVDLAPPARTADLESLNPKDLPEALHQKTLVVSGLPNNATPRELHLLFTGVGGYVTSTLKKVLNGKIIGFVMFNDCECAMKAKELLKDVSYDPEISQPIKLEFVNGGTEMRTKEVSPGGQSSTNYIFSSSGAPQNLTLSQLQVLRDPSATTFLTPKHLLHVATSSKDESSTVNHLAFSFAHFSCLLMAKKLKSDGKTVIFDAKLAEESCAESQKTTLFVGNLSSNFDEARFTKDCQDLAGYKAIRLGKNATGNSIAFLQFSSEKLANEARALMIGHQRYSKNKNGLRVELAEKANAMKELAIDKDLNNNSI